MDESSHKNDWSVRNGEVLIYETGSSSPKIEVKLEGDTVWLSQQQMAELYGSSRTNVVEHIQNIYSESELNAEATCRRFRQVRVEGVRKVVREIPYYNLDMIISLGYRIKSKTATKFRIWATNQIKHHLVYGYTVNRERLERLGKLIKVMERTPNRILSGSAAIIAQYLSSFNLLREYDDGHVVTSPRITPNWKMTISDARSTIAELQAKFPDDKLLGKEHGESLRGIIDGLYQTFGGRELYETVEEKAANLLYMVVKDHPLYDGNKRSAAALFIVFLQRNRLSENDSYDINESALAALTLMVAMSDPAEKDLIVDTVISMIK